MAGFRVAYRLGGSLIRAPDNEESELSALLLMYADDLVLLTTSELNLESALEILVTIATTWGMKLNYGKTKLMSIISRAPVPHATHTSPSPHHPHEGRFRQASGHSHSHIAKPVRRGASCLGLGGPASRAPRCMQLVRISNLNLQS